MSSNELWMQDIVGNGQARASMNANDSRHIAQKLRLIVAFAEDLAGELCDYDIAEWRIGGI
jgi:hypothetical protein